MVEVCFCSSSPTPPLKASRALKISSPALLTLALCASPMFCMAVLRKALWDSCSFFRPVRNSCRLAADCVMLACTDAEEACMVEVCFCSSSPTPPLKASRALKISSLALLMLAI